MSPNQHSILAQALTMGAITDEHTKAGMALAALADSDPDRAKSFASKARTPIERVEIIILSQGSTLSAARASTKAFLGPSIDVDKALIAAYSPE